MGIISVLLKHACDWRLVSCTVDAGPWIGTVCNSAWRPQYLQLICKLGGKKKKKSKNPMTVLSWRPDARNKGQVRCRARVIESNLLIVQTGGHTSFDFYHCCVDHKFWSCAIRVHSELSRQQGAALAAVTRDWCAQGPGPHAGAGSGGLQVCIFVPGCKPFQFLETTCSRKSVGEYPWCRWELPWGSLGWCGTMQGNKEGFGGKEFSRLIM